MYFDIVVWLAVVCMTFTAFMVNTTNFRSTLIFEIIPVVLSIALAVLWAADRGFIINTGG